MVTSNSNDAFHRLRVRTYAPFERRWLHDYPNANRRSTQSGLTPRLRGDGYLDNRKHIGTQVSSGLTPRLRGDGYESWVNVWRLGVTVRTYAPFERRWLQSPRRCTTPDSRVRTYAPFERRWLRILNAAAATGGESGLTPRLRGDGYKYRTALPLRYPPSGLTPRLRGDGYRTPHTPSSLRP